MGNYRGVFINMSRMKEEASLWWLYATGMGGGPREGGWTHREVTAIVQTRDGKREGGTGDNEMWTDSSCVLEVTQ